ncbi:sigma-70 family RNA polymerase sigma factor [Sphingomonas nostoxanthinifaciens]|nr:sigma-70 family RNA polymerase sigma factor [Sphingomonas nostoxanthinifaciens]
MGGSTDRAFELALIARIGAGDLSAFEQLYRRFHPRLTRFLLSVTHRPTIVEEALNDTMVVIWEKAGAYRGESKLATWIFAIAYRKALKALQRQDVPVEAGAIDEDETYEPAPDETLGRSQSHRRLIEAMAQLSADHRAVIDLTYFHELHYRDIAVVMGCPVDTVKTRMFHARRKLRALMAGDREDWLWDG